MGLKALRGGGSGKAHAIPRRVRRATREASHLPPARLAYTFRTALPRPVRLAQEAPAGGSVTARPAAGARKRESKEPRTCARLDAAFSVECFEGARRGAGLQRLAQTSTVTETRERPLWRVDRTISPLCEVGLPTRKARRGSRASPSAAAAPPAA
eukprot:357260-Chlamydomonas_euryale.AAC.2